jgi:hypothetical protein
MTVGAIKAEKVALIAALTVNPMDVLEMQSALTGHAIFPIEDIVLVVLGPVQRMNYRIVKIAHTVQIAVRIAAKQGLIAEEHVRLVQLASQIEEIVAAERFLVVAPLVAAMLRISAVIRPHPLQK